MISFTLALAAVSALTSVSARLQPKEALRRLRAPKHAAYGPASDAAAPQEAPKASTDSTVKPEYTIPVFSNPKAANYHVASSNLPLVTFSLQDSWSGQLPISGNSGETRKLFFWYWPSSATNGSDSLTVWLNGGPGCSSLEGFLEENGPVNYALGSKAPVANPYAWTTQSDMLYIEQPVGTGFTTGSPDITGEVAMANQFYGFLEQFFTVFKELQAKKLFISGESYAGFYIPFIANRIVTATAAEKAALPLSLQGLLINDGCYSSFIVGSTIPAASFAASHQAAMGLTNSQVASLAAKSKSCGYDATLALVTYPPKGKIPLPNKGKDVVASGCDVDNQMYNYAQEQNSCFNIYRVTDKCPTPSDPIEPYFSRSDVQSLLHVPNFGSWSECSNENVFLFGDDNSPYSETLLPSLLATLPSGITLWHGLDDGILLNGGDRITIQNLTWNGLQGFQTPISTPLVVGGSSVGVWHSERNLTYLEINNAGHMIPEYQPQTALHVFTWFLGKGAL